jgi:hypothetical protein
MTLKLPEWIPNPKCWLESAILLIGAIPVIYTVRSFSEIWAEILLHSSPKGAVTIAIWGVILVGFLLPIVLYGHIHQFLWGERNPKLPWWLPSHDSLSEGGWSWAIFTISLMVAITLLLWFFPSFFEESRVTTDEESGFIVVLWFFSALFCYHAKEKLQIPKDLTEKGKK